jgi:ADP-ribose pyrophosphatase YjhB (NUDIX family)
MPTDLTRLPLARRWRQQPYPAPAVLALIRRDIAGGPASLLIRRLKDPYAGFWGLVGGKWDFGEPLADAVTREVREETGLHAIFAGLRGFVDERLFPATDTDAGAHYAAFVCEVHAPTGEPAQQDEGELAWFTAAQLAALRQSNALVPTDALILDAFLPPSPPLPYIEAEVVTRGLGASDTVVRRFERIT